MAERPLYTLYKNLKAQNYDVPDDYNKFESALTRDGKGGADNRHAIYENLKAQNFDVPSTYERFYSALFEPRSKTSSRAKGGSVPMSAADRARFSARTAAILSSANNAVRQAKRNIQTKLGQSKKFDGGRVTPRLKNPLQNQNVQKNEFNYNATTGKAGTYTTTDGVEFDNEYDAAQYQNKLDKYGEEWSNAVDMGIVPSELDKADPDLSDTDVAMRQMERRQEWLNENQDRRSKELNESMHLQGSPFVASGGAVAPSSFNTAISNEANRLSDVEYGAYNTAKAYNQMLRTTLLQELKEQRQRNENAGWWKDKWNDVSNYFGAFFNTMLDPKLYSQGVMDAAISNNLLQVKKGMEDGTIKKGSNAGNAAQAMFGAIQQQQGEAAKQQKYGSKAYQYGDMSGRSLKFMADFALSGWRNVMTTGFTKAGEKVGEKMALGALGKWFTKNTGRVLGDIAGSAALAATNQLGSTYNNVIERYVGMNNENGGVTQDKNGDLKFNEGVSLGKAIKDGFGSATIENFSEMFGEYLPGAPKLLSKLGLSKVSSFFEKIGNNAYYKWLSNATNKSGIQGVMSEISEEEFGTALHAAWGDGDGSWSDFNVFTNPDAREKQIDTCLGMFYSVGFMQAPRTAVGAINAVQYFNIKHQVDKADKFGQVMFNDKWDEIKSKIDVTTNADLTKTVLDATRSDSMTAKQKGAVINYAMFLSKLRGFNQASDAKTKDKVEEGDTAPTLSNDLDDAYIEGHNADDTDKHNIQLDQNDKANELAAMLHITPEQLHDMADEDLEAMTGQNDKLDQAIYDYQVSTAKYQGVMDGAQDEVDMAAHQAAMETDNMTDLSRGTVRKATIKSTGGIEDYEVYIISGNIATHDDGSIDVSNSDDMILYYDPTTNSVEHADALMFAELGEELPADDVKAQAVADAKENAIKEVAGIIDGTVEVGSQFNVTGADGMEHTYEVLADYGDGTAAISIDGNVVENPYQLADLQQMKDLEDQKRLEAAKAQREQMEKERAAQQNQDTEQSHSSFDFNQILNDNGNVVLVDVLDKDGNTKYPDSRLFLIRDAGAKAKVVELKSDGTLVPHAVNKEDVATISSMSLDEYKQAMPESSMIEDNSGEESDEDSQLANLGLPKGSEIWMSGDGFGRPKENTLSRVVGIDEQGSIVLEDKDGKKWSASFDYINNHRELPPLDENNNIVNEENNQSESNVDENTPTPEQTPAMTLEDGTIVPMLEDGNPDFSKLTASQTAELYDTQFGDDAESVISSWVSDAKKALDKASNMTVKGKTFVEQKAAKDAKEKAIADAQAAYDSAIAIRDAYNERQLAKVEDTPEGRRNLIEKARRKFSRLKSAVKDDAEAVSQLYRDTVGSLMHRLYDSTGIDVTDTVPLTAEEYVASNLGAHSLNYEGTETSKGVKQETGLNREDFAKTQLLAADGKGTTIDALIHSLWENRPSNLESLDTQDIRNALIGVLTSGFKASEARNFVENIRIAQAENILEEQKRAQENADYAEQQKAEQEAELEAKSDEKAESEAKSKAKLDNESSNESNDLSNETDNEKKNDNINDNINVPDDATDENPLGAQRDESDLPFSAKENGKQQTTAERDADVEKNKVDDMKVVDNIVGEKTRKAFERLAKMMGADIQWQYSDKLGNGWIQETTDADGNVHRTIFITLDSSITEGAQFIFGHEMTHQIKKLNPAAYNELIQLVLDTYGSDAFDKAVDETMKRYSDAGFSGRARDYYAEEVVADSVGEMIRDLNLAHTLAMKMSHPLLAAIHEILQKIKLAFFGTEYSDVTKNIIRSIEQAYVKTANGEVTNSETGEDVSYSLRQKPEPKKKGIGYKVFVLKDGKLYPPMVANPDGAATPVGVWLDADAAPIAGESKTGRPQVKQGGKGTQGGSGKLAYRPGWHLGVVPYAIQFNRKDADGNKTLFPKNFVFAEVEYAADVDYQEEARQEGINPSGKYQHSLAGLKHLPTDGFYMYRTNPNPETDPWVITGAMKVNRILTRAEQAELVKNAGREPQQIQDGDIVTDDVVNIINQEIADAPKFSLKVYHGSGADFTEFDFDHMGEGAGSQMFGWGGYVTSSEEIGKSYTRLAAQSNGLKREGLKSNISRAQERLPFMRDGEYKTELENEIKQWQEELSNIDESKNLYEVDIPDDNGSNYLEWYGDVPSNLDKEKLAELILDKTGAKEKVARFKATPAYLKALEFDIKNRINEAKTGQRLYVNISSFVSEKDASEILSSLGYTGIKYPAGTIMGGAEEGDTNYVIFKPEDMKITEHTKFSLKDPFKMSDNEKKERGDRLIKAPAVDVASGVIQKTADLSARKAAEKWWNDNVAKPLVFNTEVGDVVIDEKSIKDSLAHRYSQAKLDSITSLPAGFVNSVYIGTISDFVRTRDNVQNHYFAYPINYDGKRNYVFCRVMQDTNKNRLYVHEVFVADKINEGNTLQTAASKPHGGIALYKEILANVLSAAKIDNSSETTKENGEKFSLKDEKIKSVAEKFGVNEDDVAMYANAVERGSTADAARARANIKRYLKQVHKDEISSFKDFARYYKPVEAALMEYFGDLDAMIDELRKRVEAERNAMEAARKRAQEEEEKRQKHLEELSLIPTDELDKRYMDAIANNDESTAREMLDELARRNGYGEVDSDYQGQGAWAAPSNPQYESDEARRADIENSPDVNLEDIALGYSLQPDDYFDNPIAYMNNTAYGLESAHVIKNALDAIKNGEKDVNVKVYRAVPNSVKEGKLRNGDWVTPSKKYAEMHGDNRLEGKYRIIEDEVPANQLWWDGNDANEFGFDDGREYRYKNAKNNRKLNDLITYDNNGNVIPPSKRFNSRKNDIRFSLKAEKEKIVADAKANGTYMTAPNGEKTKLNAEQWATVRTTNFKNWFGDWENDPDNASKVVDENGEPMVVWHGRSAEFNTFEKKEGVRFIMGLEDKVKAEGFFFSPDKGLAEEFASNSSRHRGGKANVVPCFLNIRRPMDLTGEDYDRIYEDVTGWEYMVGMDTQDNLWGIMDEEGMADKIKEKGYDGAIFVEEVDDSYEPTKISYCALDANQIKSAENNNGDFSADNNDIRFSLAGERGAATADKAEERTTRMDFLSVARKMEEEKKDAKAIKMATGWERGADGKWRFEIPDFHFNYEKWKDNNKEILDSMDDKDYRNVMRYEKEFYEDLSPIRKKNFDELRSRTGYKIKQELTLGDVLEGKGADNLFKYYPELRGVKFKFSNLGAATLGIYNSNTNTIEVNDAFLYSPRKAERNLQHEVQHVIQHLEGFAKGGNEFQVRGEVKKKFSEVIKQIRQLRAEGKEDEAKAIVEKNRGLYNAYQKNDDYNSYKSLAGEVEARNVQERMNMTSEERRKTLAESTEDVARKDQIFLGVGDVSFSLRDMADGKESGVADMAEDLKSLNTPDEVDDAIKTAIDDMPSGWQMANKKIIHIAKALGENRKSEIAGEEPKFSIRTYHGTGASFDKFDLSHALEGEGSESFGHGVYVTNSSKIGREYAQRAKQRKMADLYKNMRYPDGVKGDIFKRRVFGEMVNDVATGGSVASAKEFAKKRVGADANDIQRTIENLKDREKGTEYEQNLKDRLAEYKEGFKWIDSLDEDYLTQGNANRYDVDIPDDNGSNYLDWEGTIPDSLDKQKVAEDSYKVVSDNQGFKDSKVTTLNDFIAHTLKNYVDTTDVSASVEKLKSDIKDVIEDDLADDDVLALNEYLKDATTDDVLATIWYNDLVRDIDNAETGEELYRKLSTYVGDNAASQILSDNGLVGIKYPAGMIHGGAKEGDYNYVIFDENNANIVGNTRFSLRYDQFEHDLNQWKKDNNLPKDAKRPTIPQRNAGESAVDFLRRVDEYRKQMALWKTAPTYEQHLLSDDTALGEFNRELQRGSVLKRIAFQDSMLAIRKAQEAIMKEVGVDRLNMAEDAYTAENRSHGKGKNEFEEYNNEFLQPLRKAYHQMKKVLGDSYDNVRIYMMAKHGLERDAQMAFKMSLDADYEDVAQRSAAYRAYKGDMNRIINDSDLEFGRVDFTTWRQRDNALRAKYSPSYMNYRYDKNGIVYDYSGLSSLFDGSDFEEAAYKLVKDIEDKYVTETHNLWDATNAATKKILRDGYKAGMMSKDTYQYVRDMYSHYIPLRGWDGTTADQVWDYVGGGKGAFNQTLKTAHGRTSIADDPIAYIENMAESGILLNNKNWVKQHLMLLAQNHPTSLLTLSKAWYVKSTDANGNEEWIPATPQITSQMNSNQVKSAIDAFEKKMEQMAQTGDATQKRDGLNISYPQTHSEEREHEVRVMKDGEEYVIYVNGDPQLAQAMNNTRAHRVREIQSGKLDRAAAWLGRKMAAAYTSRSPLFIPSNYFRDLTMTLASTAIREDAKYNYLLRKNLATSWNLGFMLRDYQSGKLREKVSNGNATPKEQMFYDFMMNGGETGFVSSLDVEDLKKKFKNDLKDLDRWKANPVKVGHAIMDSIEFLNRAIEDSNRFAVYMTSIQYGRSIDEAVNDAKNVTLNFNRKGTGEYGWQTIRNLYLFINPAVQSLHTLGALAKHHPFKFTAVTVSWIASGVLVPIVNAALMQMAAAFLGGDGDDDKDWYKDISKKYWQFSKWDRRNNFIMWVPFTHEFIKIPLAQEFRAFYGVGDMIASKMMGGELAEQSWEDYGWDLLGQVVDMLPLDPTGYDGNIAVSLMPNPIRPVFELAFNVDFTGKPLFKDTEYNKYDPNFTKAYVGTPDWLVRASRMMNSIGNDYPDVQQNKWDALGNPRFSINNPAVVDHVLSSYLGGTYTMGSQVLGLLTKSLNDPKEIKVADIPLFSKFVSNPDDRPVTKKQGDEFWSMKENHDRAANTLSKLKKQAKVDGDYSMLERFYGSEEYKQYKQDDVKVKKYEEDKKKERAEESGEEYRPHKLNAEDIYKSHATPNDDFEDLKLKQLYTKLNGFKTSYDLLVDTAPSQSDGYYNTNKAAIDAIDEISLDKQEISELKKGFLDDGKDAYNFEDMKRIRELRKKILAVLEKANKVVVANQKANTDK